MMQDFQNREECKVTSYSILAIGKKNVFFASASPCIAHYMNSYSERHLKFTSLLQYPPIIQLVTSLCVTGERDELWTSAAALIFRR